MKRFFPYTGLGALVGGAVVFLGIPHRIPKPVIPPAPKLEYVFRTGVLDAAKVFGRAPGCENTEASFIQDVNEAAARAGVDTKIVAATIAVESGCNPLAVSNKGAVGLMQIRVVAWKDKYDFQGKINLLNRKDNLQVGTEILGSLVKQYGLQDGVRRYQGVGSGGDEFYVSKILKLAGAK